MHLFPQERWLTSSSTVPAANPRWLGVGFIGLWLAGFGAGLPRAEAQLPPSGVSERDQQARQLFEQGREAYSDGRYRDAWAYFHEAYQLSGRPELLFNIGQTADRLGQENDALKAFSMYLERLPAASNRKDVENRVRALRERVAAAQHANAPAPAVLPAHTPSRPVATVQPSLPLRPTPPLPAAHSAPAPKPDTPAPREPRRGFYLRAAIGAGYRADALTRTTSTLLSGSSTDYSIDGVGLSLDLGVGWGVLPGFALGGALMLDFTGSPTLTQGPTTSSLASANLTTVGPFIDWYPIRKTLGWHIHSGFGLGIFRYKNEPSNGAGIEGNALGASFMLGTGYELNLSRSVALGVEVRFLAGTYYDAVDDWTTSHGLVTPSVLATFTWF